MINNRDDRVIKAFGLKLRELRIARGLSQGALAILADMVPSQVGRLERGQNNPTLSTLYVLAVVLRVDLNALVTVEFPEAGSFAGNF